MKKTIALVLVLLLFVSLLPVAVLSADSLSSRLLAEYNFDDETLSDTAGGKTATLYNDGAVTNGQYVSGVSGKALQLSTKGAGDKLWLSVPYSVFSGHTDSFTLSLWYKASGYNTSGEDSELFSFYNSSAEKFLYYSPAATAFQDKGFAMKWDGTYGYANVITPYAANQWVHMTFSVTPNGSGSRITAFVNGAAVEVDQGGEWANCLMSSLGINTFTIGGKNPYKGGDSPACLFYGAVDEVRIYAGAFSAAEAVQVYQEGLNGASADPSDFTDPTEPSGGTDRGTLLAEYNFNEGTTADSVHGRNAALYNGDAAAAGKYADGVSGKALKLSAKGTGEKYWLSVPYSVFSGSEDSFTLSLWYKATDYNSSGEDSELFSFYNGGAEKFLFYSPASTSFQDKGFTMKWDGTYGYANVITAYEKNKWTHLVFSVEAKGSGSVISAYVNGAQVEVDQGGAWANSLMSSLGINTFTIGGKNPYKGGDSPACLFYGLVDEIRLYSGVLTAQEAKDIYTSAGYDGSHDGEEPEQTEPAPGPDGKAELLAEYNFNDQTTRDSVNGHNATLYNNDEKAAAVFGTGVSGKALKLSTKGTLEKYWLSIPFAALGDSRDNFSLSLWYKASGYNTSGEDSELFSLYNSSEEKFIYYSPAAVNFQDKAFTMKWDGTYGYTNIMTPYAENEWVHLVFCITPSGGETVITAYVNGEAVENDRGERWTNSLISALGIDTFTIGGKNPYKGGPTPMCLFFGMVDEIRLYSGTLTQAEAKALYESPDFDPDETEPEEKPTEPATVSGKLLAEYNFDSQTTKDSVAGKNAALYNNSSYASGKYVTGVKGKALQLSTKGAGDKMWLSVPYSVFSESRNTFTISLWYAATDYNSAKEDSELFSFYNSGYERFLYYSPAAIDFQDKAFTMKWDGSYGYANVITPYAKNKWVHLVYVVKEKNGRSVITAYVNGEPVEVDQGGNWGNSTMTKLGINRFTIGGKNPYKGGDEPACLFYGLVDEVKIYAGELTPADAKLLYQEGNPNAPVTPVSAYAATGGGNSNASVDDTKPGDGVLTARYTFNNQNTKDTVGTYDAALYDNETEVQGVYVDGVAGKALQLSTKGEAEKYWLSIPYEVFGEDPDNFSLSIWYKGSGYNTSGEDSEMFSLYNSSAERFIFYSPAAVAFQDKGFTMKWNGKYGYANVIAPYAEEQWTHLVYVVQANGDRSAIRAYVNGKAVEVDQGGDWENSLMSLLGVNTFTIGGKNPNKGGDPPACLFYGAVDEIEIYSGTLTQVDAERLYHAPEAYDGSDITEEETEPETTEPAGSEQAPEPDLPGETDAAEAPARGGGLSVNVLSWIVAGGAVTAAGLAALLLLRKKKGKL